MRERRAPSWAPAALVARYPPAEPRSGRGLSADDRENVLPRMSSAEKVLPPCAGTDQRSSVLPGSSAKNSPPPALVAVAMRSFAMFLPITESTISWVGKERRGLTSVT